MMLRTLTVALGVLIGMTSLADARCQVGDPNWPPYNRITAQRLARTSARNAVRQAYRDDECTIIAIMHHSGRECRRGKGNNHVTIRLDNGVAYHVFNYRNRNSNFYCTTP
jgi:hypothetical protein